jgi:hypothetical protein
MGVSQQSSLREQIQQAKRQADEIAAGLSPEQLVSRPDPAKWSIAECFAHLNVTAEIVQPLVAAAIAEGKSSRVHGKGPHALSFFGRLLVWIAEPPPKFNMSAPRKVAPRIELATGTEVIAKFLQWNDQWLRLVDDMEGLDLEKIRVAPLFRRMPRLRLSDPIPWMLAHQRRHLWQAEQVRQKLEIASAKGIGAQ